MSDEKKHDLVEMLRMIGEKRRELAAAGGDPVNPVNDWIGLTRRQYAAIELRVPDSGLEWLDAMIIKAAKNDLMQAAIMSGEPDLITKFINQIEKMEKEQHCGKQNRNHH